MRSTEANDFVIESDGRTVWVHRGAETIGRFGRMGVDVHSTMAEQTEGAGQCKCCTHGLTGWKEWRLFQFAMRQHHGADVGDRWAPDRLIADWPNAQFYGPRPAIPADLGLEEWW